MLSKKNIIALTNAFILFTVYITSFKKFYQMINFKFTNIRVSFCIYIFWPICRIAAALVYYGLSINATNIAGNKYLNFTLVTAVEIPACLLYVFIMTNMSRKTSLSSMFVLNAVTCALYNFTPESKLEFFYFYLFIIFKITFVYIINGIYNQ